MAKFSALPCLILLFFGLMVAHAARKNPGLVAVESQYKGVDQAGNDDDGGVVLNDEGCRGISEEECMIRRTLAAHEYFIRHKDGCTLNSDKEKEKKLAQCLLAAIERRVSHGLRLDVSAEDRPCLLSDVTRTLRENGLTITRADLTTQGERAMGSFFVAGMSGHEVDQNMVETLGKEFGGSVRVVNINNNSNNNDNISRKSSGRKTFQGSCDGNSNDGVNVDYHSNNNKINNNNNNKSKLTLGGILWAHIEKFSSSFGPIRL